MRQSLRRIAPSRHDLRGQDLGVSHPLLTSEVIVRLCGAGHVRAAAIRPVARLRRIELHTTQKSQCSCVTHKPTAARNGISIAADNRRIISRVGAARPDSMKLTCRCVVRTATAKSN